MKSEDKFNYDDPIIFDLLDKSWDEEIAARKRTTDIIVDVEAINDLLEIAGHRTPSKKGQTLRDFSADNLETSTVRGSKSDHLDQASNTSRRMVQFEIECPNAQIESSSLKIGLSA
ncbi:hypothetical protein Salat_1469800 [Sesamum alatum]|uniref:Uncharacterized protein n=1 Tax=Sesamum alatum TaxID=300844 RepID=A0AAE2CM65_9LAMI|nr:hypothetical protein Salat_1469800 [Sesamum alatum]